MDRFLRNAGAGTAIGIAVTGLAVFWAMIHGQGIVQLIAAGVFAAYVVALAGILAYGVWLGGIAHSTWLARYRWPWAVFVALSMGALIFLRGA